MPTPLRDLQHIREQLAAVAKRNRELIETRKRLIRHAAMRGHSTRRIAIAAGLSHQYVARLLQRCQPGRRESLDNRVSRR